MRNEELAKNYTYTERAEERKLDSDGAVKDVESKPTTSATFTARYHRLIARDGEGAAAEGGG
ncbi:MAG: hypothetical protein R2748_14620 [Bryobacterales bacterium]